MTDERHSTSRLGTVVVCSCWFRRPALDQVTTVAYPIISSIPTGRQSPCMEGMRCVCRPRQPDTAHLAMQALPFFLFSFALAANPCLEIRDRRPRVTHASCDWIGMLGPRHEWKTARGQEIRARVFPGRRAANRKAPCRDQGAGDCYLKQWTEWILLMCGAG